MQEDIERCDKCEKEQWMAYVFFYRAEEDTREQRLCMKCWRSDVLPLVKSEEKGKRRGAR